MRVYKFVFGDVHVDNERNTNNSTFSKVKFFIQYNKRYEPKCKRR
jgi:hypothetical protein